MLAQAREIEAGESGDAEIAGDEETQEQKMSRLAATQPGFEFKIEKREIQLDYRNFESATVRFHPLDLEFLFSSNPFVEYETRRAQICSKCRACTTVVSQ